MKKIVLCVIICSVLAPNADAGMIDTFMGECKKVSMQGCYQAGMVY